MLNRFYNPILGTGFGSETSSVSVNINDTACAVTFVSATSVSCVLGVHAAGFFPISLLVEEKGLASGFVQFEYELAIDSLSANEGMCDEQI